MSNKVLTVNHNQIPRILLLGWLSKIPICLVGSVGTGKTTSANYFHEMLSQQDESINKYVVFPGLIEAADIGGIPYRQLSADKKHQWIEFAMLKILPFDTNEKCIIIFDEFDRADKYVQNACTQILLNGKIHGHEISPNAFSIMTMNGTSDIYTTPLSEAIRNRVCSIFVSNVTADNMDAWDVWAEKEGIHPSIQGFAHFMPDLVEREIEYAELAIPTPRSRDMLSYLMDQLDNVSIRTDDIIQPMVAGLIGKAGAIEFGAYMDTFRNLPKFQDILNDPNVISQDMYNNPATSFALAAYLIKNITTRDQAIQLIAVVSHLRREIAFWVMDSIKRKYQMLFHHRNILTGHNSRRYYDHKRITNAGACTTPAFRASGKTKI